MFLLPAALLLFAVDLTPVLTPAERTAYRKLSSEAERESFRQAFWKDKRFSEAEYAARAAHADQAFGWAERGSDRRNESGAGGVEPRQRPV